MKYAFYGKPLVPGAGTLTLPPGLRLELWRPGWWQPLPRGFPLRPFLIWSLFHLFRVFATRDYAILLILEGQQVVHRTCLIPAHFRFPFMVPGDLQAAGIWTHPDRRGQGLGLVALQEIFRRWQAPERTLWYMVREDNHPSIRLAEKGGLRLLGRGLKVAVLGLGLLGGFHITEGPQLQAPRQPGRVRQLFSRAWAGRRSQRPTPGQE